MKLTIDDPKLTAYALGELPAAERAAVEAELRQSPELRRAVEEVRQMEAALTRELAAEPCPALRQAQIAKVLATAPRRGSWFARLFAWEPVSTRRWKFEVALAGYAAVVTFVLIAVLWSRGPSSREIAGQPTLTNQAVGASAQNATAPTNAITPTPSPNVVEQAPQRRPVVQAPAPKLERLWTPRPKPAQPIPLQVVQPSVVVAATNSAPSLPPVVLPVQPAPVLAVRSAANLAPLALALPMPSFKGTPDDLPKGEHIEEFTDKPRAAFLAPVGVRNLALNGKMTSSDKSPITGTVSQITDGNKEAIDDAVVEMHKGVQWVQLDLEKDFDIYALVIWHDHRYVQVFRCVVVQTADDPDFTQNVRTLFNNDYENVAGLGLGSDKQYFETNQGKLIDTKGVKARYLRFYSKGSNASALNCYTEIEAWGLPSQ